MRGSPNIAVIHGNPVALKCIDEERYYLVLGLMRVNAQKLGCTLFEVEQLWRTG